MPSKASFGVELMHYDISEAFVVELERPSRLHSHRSCSAFGYLPSIRIRACCKGRNSGHSLWPENRGSEGAIAGLTQPSDDGGRSLTKAPGLIRWFSLVGGY